MVHIKEAFREDQNMSVCFKVLYCLQEDWGESQIRSGINRWMLGNCKKGLFLIKGRRLYSNLHTRSRPDLIRQRKSGAHQQVNPKLQIQSFLCPRYVSFHMCCFRSQWLAPWGFGEFGKLTSYEFRAVFSFCFGNLPGRYNILCH